MLTLITPTRNRAAAFALLQRWVARQAYSEPYQWIVVNDGDEPYDYALGQEVYDRPRRPRELHSLCSNLLHAIPHVRGDKVLILEDDDYYTPDYLATMARLLDEQPLVGEGQARYYNARERRHRQFGNGGHASLAQTGMRAEVLPLLAEICRKGNPMVDLRLWGEWPGGKHVALGLHLHVGVKGMPGEAGIGKGHRETMGSPDHDLAVFRRWGLPEDYLRFHRPLPGLAAPTSNLIAPIQTKDCAPPHEGRVGRKPWECRVTAAIPHLETPEPLEWVIRLLRLQTESPYILVIDTGSSDEVRGRLEELRAEDVEVHYLRAHSWIHSSEPVAAAMDAAFGLCRSEYMYCCHADSFIRRRDWLEWLLNRCSASNPAVGYQMSDRSWITADWEWMISHTATMLHMPSIWKSGATWSFHRYGAETGRSIRPGDRWPDTETGFNHYLRKAGIVPDLLGPEFNYARQVDDNIDHVRSFASSQVYAGVGPAEYRAQKDAWMAAALSDARARVEAWSNA